MLWFFGGGLRVSFRCCGAACLAIVCYAKNPGRCPGLCWFALLGRRRLVAAAPDCVGLGGLAGHEAVCFWLVLLVHGEAADGDF